MAKYLTNYYLNAGDIADELLYYIYGEYKPFVLAIEQNKSDALYSMTVTEAEQALAFLKKTQGQRDKALKHVNEETALMILRARRFGLEAANALEFADECQFIPGSSYRVATERAARHIILRPFEVSVDEIIGRKTSGRAFPPHHHFEDDSEDD
ncbi:MAG: hypothetical protein H6872_05645 [Methylobacteriaceae bacterium]|nr:hypothetical protein [Methylobacteriaceae bacterium]